MIHTVLVRESMKDFTDEIIAASVQAGDIEVFGTLVLRYETKLKRYARKFLSQSEDIEDLVQDVFVKAYQNIKSFDTNQRFSPWIYRIAHNTFVNELKRKSRYDSFFTADTLLPFLPAKETTDGSVLQAELSNEMVEVVTQLSPKYREVIILHYFEELSYQEISEVLHIPITTVGVRMTRGRQKLRQLCKVNNIAYE